MADLRQFGIRGIARRSADSVKSRSIHAFGDFTSGRMIGQHQSMSLESSLPGKQTIFRFIDRHDYRDRFHASCWYLSRTSESIRWRGRFKLCAVLACHCSRKALATAG